MSKAFINGVGGGVNEEKVYGEILEQEYGTGETNTIQELAALVDGMSVGGGTIDDLFETTTMDIPLGYCTYDSSTRTAAFPLPIQEQIEEILPSLAYYFDAVAVSEKARIRIGQGLGSTYLCSNINYAVVNDEPCLFFHLLDTNYEEALCIMTAEELTVSTAAAGTMLSGLITAQAVLNISLFGKRD